MKKQEKAETAETPKIGVVITKEQLQKDYSVISGPGTKTVKAANVSQTLPVLNSEQEHQENPISGEPLYKQIINLKAFTKENAERVKELFEDREEIDLTELNGLTMSANYIHNGSPKRLPMKGQEVEIFVDLVESKRQGKKVLGVTDFIVQESASAESFSF